MHTTVREIFRTRYRHHDGGLHLLSFEADGFLRAQVRMMIAAAMACAKGSLTLEQLLEQLDGSTRHTTALAPPSGLYLARILY